MWSYNCLFKSVHQSMIYMFYFTQTKWKQLLSRVSTKSIVFCHLCERSLLIWQREVNEKNTAIYWLFFNKIFFASKQNASNLNKKVYYKRSTKKNIFIKKIVFAVDFRYFDCLLYHQACILTLSWIIHIELFGFLFLFLVFVLLFEFWVLTSHFSIYYS